MLHRQSKAVQSNLPRLAQQTAQIRWWFTSHGRAIPSRWPSGFADESGSDLYRVTPKEAYSEDFDSCADRAKNELDNGIRPEISALMDAETMAQYGTVYVGFPIWWYDLPMAMTAFLENYDLSGKTIIPFFSHNGSSSGASAPDTLEEICMGATVLSDSTLSISGDSVESSEEQIREWVGGLKK